VPTGLQYIFETKNGAAMVLTVLEGSAHSTPILIDSLARECIGSRVTGRDRHRLAAVTRASLLLSRGSLEIEAFAKGEWRSALAGSDVVLVQIRVGGYEGRQFDESFPLPFGIPGDEGLGPGGLSAAHRSWPVLRELLQLIRSAAPASRVVLLTSPATLLIRLAAKEFPELNILAVCELPWTTLQTLCRRDMQDITFDYLGTNHLGWLYNVRRSGADVLGSGDHGGFPSSSLIQRLRAYPLKYLRLHYEQANVVTEQTGRAISRSHEVAGIAGRAFEVFPRGDRAAILDHLSTRRAEWYPSAVVPVIRSLCGVSIETPLFLTAAGSGKDVQERRYCAISGNCCSVPALTAPSPEIADLMERFVSYDRLAAVAVLDGGAEAFAAALAMHPWVNKEKTAIALAKEILTSTRQGEFGLCQN